MFFPEHIHSAIWGHKKQQHNKLKTFLHHNIYKYEQSFICMKHELPTLEYSHDALEPFIDAKTMEIHHSKHHQAYADKLNAALEKHPELQEKSVEELLSNLSSIPNEIRVAVQNNGGGVLNHNIFFSILKKDISCTGEIAEAIDKTFGSFDKFKNQFSDAALTQFGSGWAWLVIDKEKKLHIMKTPNQNSPVSEGLTPILGIDIWEHAYYLKYQNKRPEYITQFFNVINWEKVNERFLQAR